MKLVIAIFLFVVMGFYNQVFGANVSLNEEEWNIALEKWAAFANEHLEWLIGECVSGSTRFNEIADMDHDGCITNKDRDILLRELSKQE